MDAFTELNLELFLPLDGLDCCLGAVEFVHLLLKLLLLHLDLVELLVYTLDGLLVRLVLLVGRQENLKRTLVVISGTLASASRAGHLRVLAQSFSSSCVVWSALKARDLNVIHGLVLDLSLHQRLTSVPVPWLPHLLPQLPRALVSRCLACPLCSCLLRRGGRLYFSRMSLLDWLLLPHRKFSRIVLAQEGLDDRALPSTTSIGIRNGIELVLAPVEGFGGACQVLQVDCKARVQLGPAGWIDLQALLVLEVHVCPLEGPL